MSTGVIFRAVKQHILYYIAYKLRWKGSLVPLGPVLSSLVCRVGTIDQNLVGYEVFFNWHIALLFCLFVAINISWEILVCVCV